MATSKEKQFWTEFFDLYRRKPELWKVKSEDYRDRAKKNLAYNALIRKCKEVEPNAGKDFVSRKINSFRSVYRRELKKVNKSLKSDNGNEYVPTLWYYKCLNFLKDQEESIDEECDGVDSENERYESEKRKVIAFPKKKKKTTVDPDELLELATKRLKKCDDYAQTVANVWASEFRLASEDQQFFAKKAIDDILFEARLGTLHRNALKFNHNPEIFNASDTTVEYSRITSSPNRSMPNQTDYSKYNNAHLPNHSKTCNTTHSLKSENYNTRYSDINETYQETSPSSQHNTINIEHVSVDPLIN